MPSVVGCRPETPNMIIRTFVVALIAAPSAISAVSLPHSAGSVSTLQELLACNTSSGWFAMPTTTISGAWSCSSGGGVPNANLAAAMDAEALSLGPDCAGCVLPIIGCFPDPTIIIGPGWIIGDEQTTASSVGLTCPPNDIAYRRSITMPNGQAFITCGTCDE